jgi:hypothetical protein
MSQLKHLLAEIPGSREDRLLQKIAGVEEWTFLITIYHRL